MLFGPHALLPIFLADQGNYRINSRTNFEYTDRHAAAPPLTPPTALDMLAKGPSHRAFDYASRAKPGKATWQIAFRLKDEEYRANMVYLKTCLKRSTDIEWDDHTKTNTNTQALDKIVYHF